MVEFNPDGSLKITGQFAEKRNEKERKMKNQMCLLVRKELVRSTAPKKCLLRIKLSDAITDSRFVETTYSYFNKDAETPTKIIKVNEKEFEVEIGTDLRRCSDCSRLIARYREFLDGNIIEERGSCTYERKENFCYEDYFL